MPTTLCHRRPILTAKAVRRALEQYDAARTVGRRIRWAREGAGVTRRDLAEFTGLSSRTLALIERGERTATGRELAAIARGLGTSIAFLQTRASYVDRGGRLSAA